VSEFRRSASITLNDDFINSLQVQCMMSFAHHSDRCCSVSNVAITNRCEIIWDVMTWWRPSGAFLLACLHLLTPLSRH